METARVAHNDSVKAAKKAMEEKKAVFFAAQRDILTEFGARVPQIGTQSPGKSPGKQTLRRGSLTSKASVPVVTGPIHPAKEVTATLREYQKEGLRFLVNSYQNGVSAILGDEMGLGKTLQTIAFLAHLKFTEGLTGPSLVVAPLSVLSSWLVEFKKFCPSLRVVKLHSSDMAERERLKDRVMNDFTSFDVVVTTYEMAKSANMSAIVRRLWWRYIILDEGHVVKNENSQISQAMRGFHYQNALLLTGTPLQNNLHELWALLNFLYPDIFIESEAFDEGFNLGKSQVDQKLLMKASILLQPLMIRRIKADVEKSLPPKLETKIACPLSDCQRFWYKRLLLKDSSLLKKLENDNATEALGTAGSSSWKKLQSLMMQLRKCANHPYLFPDADQGSQDPEAIVTSSGKMVLLDRLLQKLKDKNHRVVLFSQFTSMLDLIEEYCNLRGWRYCRLDGSVNRVQRTVDISCFNADGSKLFIFLMSTRAGGLGVNLQSADTCILYDSDWNPQPDLQAMARVHRIGQKKKVHVYRLVAGGTVEERIVQRAEKKLYLDQVVNRNMSGDSEQGFGDAGVDEDVSASEMLKALQFGAHAVLKAQAGQVSGEELDLIIDRNRTEDQTFGNLEGGTSHDAAEFDAEQVSFNMRELEGESYGAVKEKTFLNCSNIADIASAWQEIQTEQRVRTSRVQTEWVKGVGEVAVLKENSGVEETNVVASAPTGPDRQLAGRDYDHENHCLRCWDGGELVCCDFCPASYHIGCLGLKSDKCLPKMGYSCPHHSCVTCGRKSAAAGGLLFRCMMCPDAYCEDHLPPTACIVGKNERFQALGHRHPKQGCYVFCGADCVLFAKGEGLATEEVIQATASMVLGSTGVDLTKSSSPLAPVKFVTDTRSSFEKLTESQKAELLLTLRHSGRKTVHDILPNLERIADLASVSAIDILHDVIYDTDRFTTNRDRKTVPIEAVQHIQEWAGATDVSEEDRRVEEAAAKYLEFSRKISAYRGEEIKNLTKCFMMTYNKKEKAPNEQKIKAAGFSGVSKTQVIHMLSLFLAYPCLASLIALTEDHKNSVSDKETMSLYAAMEQRRVGRMTKPFAHVLASAAAYAQQHKGIEYGSENKVKYQKGLVCELPSGLALKYHPVMNPTKPSPKKESPSKGAGIKSFFQKQENADTSADVEVIVLEMYYTKVENETPLSVAAVMKIAVMELVNENRDRYPGITSKSRLKAGTGLYLPLKQQQAVNASPKSQNNGRFQRIVASPTGKSPGKTSPKVKPEIVDLTTLSVSPTPPSESFVKTKRQRVDTSPKTFKILKKASLGQPKPGSRSPSPGIPMHSELSSPDEKRKKKREGVGIDQTASKKLKLMDSNAQEAGSPSLLGRITSAFGR